MTTNRRSKWNYRIVRRRFSQEELYCIHEVYYDKDGKPDGLTEIEVSPSGDSIDEFKASLALYLKALDRPVLDYETLTDIEQ